MIESPDGCQTPVRRLAEVALGLPSKGVWLAVVLVLLVALGLVGGAAGLWWDEVPESGRSPAPEAGGAAPPDPTLKGRADAPARGSSTGLPPLLPPVDLDAVDRDLDLHGVVVEPDGTPVAGAIVEVVTYPWRRATLLANDLYDEVEHGLVTSTAVDGTFALRLRRGTRVTLRVRAEGFPEVTTSGRQPGERVRIVVRAGVSFVVRAVDAKDAPWAGVPVELRPRRREGGEGLPREGTTDEEGRVRFDGLPAGGSARLETSPTRATGWTGETVRLPEEGGTEHVVVVPAARVLLGRVVDAVTARPVAGARVGVGWTFAHSTRTDADGRYELGGWTGGGYREVHVLAMGYARAQRVVASADRIDFALERGFAVTGRVVDAGRRPLPRARVAVVGDAMREGVQHISTAAGRTDESGHFRLPDLDPALPHVLVVLAEGAGRHLLAFGAPPPPLTVLDLGDVVVREGRLVAGRVLDAEGRPLAGVTVELNGANSDWDRRRPEADQHVSHSYGRTEERFTDDLGRFSFGDLAAGRYALVASRKGADPDPAAADVELRPGSDATGVELRFAASRSFRVLVRDASGGPVAGVVVCVEPQGDSLHAMTDGSGAAVFRLDTGTRRVEVGVDAHLERPLLAPDAEVVEVDTTVHVVTLRDAAVVSGRLVDERGEPVGRGLVRARRGTESVDLTTSDTAGSFRLLFEPGGPVDIEFLGVVWSRDERGFAERCRRPIEARRRNVEPGRDDVLLKARRVPAEGRLSVQVVTAAGAPVEGAAVRLLPPPAERTRAVETGPDGRASFEGLTPYPVTVAVVPPEASKEALASARREGVLPEGQTLVVTLPEPLRLRGTCVDANGKPLANVYVCATGVPGRPSTASDADGRFVLALPPDVEVPIVVEALTEARDGVFLTATAPDVDPDEGPVRLVLEPDWSLR